MEAKPKLNYWNSTLKWLALLLPVSIFTSDWAVIHAILLFAIGPPLIGASMSSKYPRYWPFTIAFCLSMGVVVFGNTYLKESGVSHILPNLLGQR